MDTTYEKRGHKRRRCGAPAGFKPSESESSGLQTRREPQTPDFVQGVLSDPSNTKILRLIFTFLDDPDLESCRNVSRYWRSVADPLVSIHYDMELDTFYNLQGNQGALAQHSIRVQERARSDRKCFTKYESDSGVIENLGKVLLTHKVTISLTIPANVDLQNDKFINFLSNFGSLVVDLCFTYRGMNAVEFCKMLVQKFPNLRKLKLSNSSHLRKKGSNHCYPSQGGSARGQNVNPHLLLPNKHQQLRTISFGNSPLTCSEMETILTVCENLKEIHDFPVQLINAIEVAGKASALKSLFEVHPTRGPIFGSPQHSPAERETILRAYKKLAELKPNLSSLKFNRCYFLNDPPFDSINSSLLSVLASSKDSLKSLEITLDRFNEVRNFPQLKGLRVVKFVRCSCRSIHGVRIPLPPQISSQEIFPNVHKIFAGYDLSNINHYNEMTPLDSHENRSGLGNLDSKNLPLLQRLFPSIKSLEIRSFAPLLPSNLEEISQFWSRLESLTISVHDKNRKKHRSWQKGRIDCAFTGLPERIINQLEDPEMKKKFTREEIQGFKDRSIIHKMKELKELTLILHDLWLVDGSQRTDTCVGLTPTAHEFGFGLLPELKVIIKIDSKTKDFQAVRRDLEPLARCSNIKIEEGQPLQW